MKLKEIQDMLMREMERLDKESIDPVEISRSNALSQTATSYLKSVNVAIRIREIAEKTNTTVEKLNVELGINNEE